jgi:hypothetical protein
MTECCSAGQSAPPDPIAPAGLLACGARLTVARTEGSASGLFGPLSRRCWLRCSRRPSLVGEGPWSPRSTETLRTWPWLTTPGSSLANGRRQLEEVIPGRRAPQHEVDQHEDHCQHGRHHHSPPPLPGSGEIVTSGTPGVAPSDHHGVPVSSACRVEDTPLVRSATLQRPQRPGGWRYRLSSVPVLTDGSKSAWTGPGSLLGLTRSLVDASRQYLWLCLGDTADMSVSRSGVPATGPTRQRGAQGAAATPRANPSRSPRAHAQ